MVAMRHPNGLYGATIPLLHIEAWAGRLKTAVLEVLHELLETADYAKAVVEQLAPRARWGKLVGDGRSLALLGLLLDALAHYEQRLAPHRDSIASQLSAQYLLKSKP